MYLKKIFLFLLLIRCFTIAEAVTKEGALWNGSYFKKKGFPPKQPDEIIEGDTVYFYGLHMHCYGHGLLDGILPFYKTLKEYDLLDHPLNIVIETKVDYHTPALANLFALIRDLFQVKKLIWLSPATKNRRLFFQNLIFYEGVPTNGPYLDHRRIFSFYRVYPNGWKCIHDLKEIGLRKDIVYKSEDLGTNLVTEFVQFIKDKYAIDLPMIKNRVLYAKRESPQRIINDHAVIKLLSDSGYEVKVCKFENMSIKDQIIETIQSEYFVGVYGSNLVNAVFLHPEAKVMIIWPEYAKYFWSRKRCIVHSAFLAVGVTLLEYDKPDHQLDVYTAKKINPDYFYRVGNKLKLKENKRNLPAILTYPGPCSFELRRADLYVDPQDFIDHLENHRAYGID
jgi:hypothetical protein